MSKVDKFREARHLSKIAPERFRLWAKLVSGQLIWVLYEYPEMSLKPRVFMESHQGLSLFGWNVTKEKVHDLSYGIFEFLMPEIQGEGKQTT